MGVVNLLPKVYVQDRFLAKMKVGGTTEKVVEGNWVETGRGLLNSTWGLGGYEQK